MRLRSGLAVRSIDLSKAGAMGFFRWGNSAQVQRCVWLERRRLAFGISTRLAYATGASRKHSHLSRFWWSAPTRASSASLTCLIRWPILCRISVIKSATAKAYFVKAGEYIQILDVDGRQCTDFQCFDARKLDKGIERALDVTTSRTFMGRDFSMPGLHSKYYDQDWTPAH